MITCIHILSGDLWGGSEAQMLLQLSELNKSKLNLKVILFNELTTYQRYRDSGLNCTILNENKGFFSLCREAKELVSKFEPTILVAHGYKELAVAIFLKLTLKCKVIATFHGLKEPQRDFIAALKATLYHSLNIILARVFADKIVCVSNALSKALNFHKAKIIRNCVKFKEILPHSISKNNRQYIFMAGRLVMVKRYDLAIKAMCNVLPHYDLELLIAGDGPERENLVLLAKSLGISESVRFLGFREDIDELMNNAEIYVICSDSEGIPTALLEALSLGVKCIATNVGGIPEVVNSINSHSCKHRCCKLVSTGSVSELTEAIISELKVSKSVNEKALDNQLIRKKISELYSPERAAKDHLDLLDSFT